MSFADTSREYDTIPQPVSLLEVIGLTLIVILSGLFGAGLSALALAVCF
jgi:hypothetical protein